MGSNAPRVLIISVNPLSRTENNGKTYASLFAGYPSDALAQLYFHGARSELALGGGAYSIEPSEFLKLHPRARISPVVPNPQQGPGFGESRGRKVALLISPVTAALKSSVSVRLAFDGLAWIRSERALASVVNWLDAFKPEVVFLSGGSAKYLYKVASWVVRRYECRLIVYLTDDYILPTTSSNLLRRLDRRINRRVIVGACRRASAVIAIGDKMSRVYEEQYGIKSFPFMNVPDVAEVRARESDERSLRLVYVGNLHTNRWAPLAVLSECVAELASRGYACSLDIYSGTMLSRRRLRLLQRLPACRFRGKVGPEGAREAIDDSSMVVHVESDRPGDVEVTRLSVSTKIGDYLAAGRPVLAIGPKSVASMELLSTLGVGPVLEVDQTKEILRTIQRLCESPQDLNVYRERARREGEARANGAQGVSAFQDIVRGGDDWN